MSSSARRASVRLNSYVVHEETTDSKKNAERVLTDEQKKALAAIKSDAEHAYIDQKIITAKTKVLFEFKKNDALNQLSELNLQFIHSLKTPMKVYHHYENIYKKADANPDDITRHLENLKETFATMNKDKKKSNLFFTAALPMLIAKPFTQTQKALWNLGLVFQLKQEVDALLKIEPLAPEKAIAYLLQIREFLAAIYKNKSAIPNALKDSKKIAAEQLQLDEIIKQIDKHCLNLKKHSNQITHETHSLLKNSIALLVETTEAMKKEKVLNLVAINKNHLKSPEMGLAVSHAYFLDFLANDLKNPPGNSILATAFKENTEGLVNLKNCLNKKLFLLKAPDLINLNRVEAIEAILDFIEYLNYQIEKNIHQKSKFSKNLLGADVQYLANKLANLVKEKRIHEESELPDVQFAIQKLINDYLNSPYQSERNAVFHALVWLDRDLAKLNGMPALDDTKPHDVKFFSANGVARMPEPKPKHDEKANAAQLKKDP